MEPVGVALGAVGLFKNCVEIFNYVQLARRFGRDFELCQIKLDVARVRFSRWGEAVGIHDDVSFAAATSGSADGNLVATIERVLEQIQQLFEEIASTSQRYEGTSQPTDSDVPGDADMRPEAHGLHERLKNITKKRQKQTSLLRKTSWALHDSERLHELVERVTGFIDDLENLVPSQTTRENMLALAKVELEEVPEEPLLRLLQDAATDVDSIMVEAVEHKCEDIAQKNSAKNIDIEEKAKLRVGNEWSAPAMSINVGFKSGNSNATENLRAKGAARVHIGNSYGGGSILDD